MPVVSVVFYALFAASFGLVAYVLAMWLMSLVSGVRARRMWRGEGLIMHELIAPTGELQDPAFGDRHLPPSSPWRRRVP